MAVKRTKVVVKVELPAGKLGLTAVGSPPAVGAVRTDSPVVGQVAPGDIIVALTRPGLGDVDTTSMDGQAVMETLVAYADREGRSLTVEKHGIYGVGVPPGPLGVQFLDGTCTVHAVKPTSPLMRATKAGDTLLSVNGQPVTPTICYLVQEGLDDVIKRRHDVIKAADDGTSERKLVFRTTAPAMRAGGTPAGMTAGRPAPATPADAWLGVPPPMPDAPSWWGMYVPQECCPDGCCYGCCCMPCAYGEVMEWATEQPGSCCGHTCCFCFCQAILPLSPIAIPCMLTDASKKTEEKIWRFHHTRGDPKAKHMGVNFETHDKNCCIAILPSAWCCGSGSPVIVAINLLISVGNFAVMKKFKATQAVAPVGGAPTQAVAAVGGAPLVLVQPAASAPPIMPPPPPTGQNFCTACGAPVQGRFCRQCGAPTSKH